MEKNLRYFIFILLFNACDIYAMNQIVSIFNFCRDKCPIFGNSKALQNNNITFDIFPWELQGKIIKTYFNLMIHEDNESLKYIDQEKLERYVLGMPIQVGIKFSQRFGELQKICQQKIAGKKFLAQELFCLPLKQQDIFIRMANRSFLKSAVEGDISLDDYKILKLMKNDDIRKGMKVDLLRGNKTLSYMGNIGALVGCLGMGCLVCMMMVPPVHHDYLFKGVVTVFLGIPILGFTSAGLAYMLMEPEHRGNIIQKIEL